MPAFTFTSPEGKNYTVNGPDGATKEQALQMLQTQLGQSVPDDIPKAGDFNAPDPGPYKPPSPSLKDRLLGASETALGMASSVVPSIVGNVVGLAKGITGGKLGTQEGIREAFQTAQNVASPFVVQPYSPTGKSMMAATGDAMNNVAAIPYGTMLELANAAAVAKPAVANAGGKVAAAVGRETDLAKMAAGKAVAKTAIPDIAASVKPDVNTRALGQKLEAIGGKVPLHTLSSNKFVRMAGEGLDNMPLSGSTKPGNKLAFNQELIKQIGGDAAPGEMLTPANFAPAMNKSGEAIGGMYDKATIPLDEALQRDLDGLSASQKLQVKDVRKVVNNYIDDIKAMADEGGVIPGKALRTQDTALGTRIRSLPPGDLRNQLSDLQETLRDALARQLPEAEVTALNGYRKQYAIGKLLEPLVAKTAFEGVSPQALMGRETATAAGKHRMAMGAAGDIGDLANIGQRFMKEQPSSGTAERGALVAGALHIGKAAVGLTAGNLYNRVGPLISSKIIGEPTVAQAVQKDLTLAPAGAELSSPTPPMLTPKPPEPSPIMSLADEPPKATAASEPPPGIDKPMHELYRQREVARSIDLFHAETDRLQEILASDAKSTDKAVAKAQLAKLKEDFAAKMNGLRSGFYAPNYQANQPIEHGFTGGIGIANPNEAPKAAAKKTPIEQQSKSGFRVKVLSHDENGRVAELMIVPHEPTAETLQ